MNDEDNPKSGNYAAMREQKTTLTLANVLTTKCEPKPAKCNCKYLVGTLIRKLDTPRQGFLGGFPIIAKQP